MVCVRKLTIEFIDCDTGEVIRQYPFQITGDDPNELYVLLNTKKLVSFLSSFIRGCREYNYLSLRFTYENSTIF